MAPEVRQGPGPIRPKPRRILTGVLLLLAIYDIVYVVVWFWRSPQPPFSDFFALHAFGQMAASTASAVYDPPALRGFEQALDPGSSGFQPCPYPPPFLLALIPLGLLPLWVAYAAWVLGGSWLYLVATLGQGWRSLSGAALAVAPTSLLSVVSGQNGFLTAALLVGGLRYLERRPILSGVLFGLLTYKFQFGLIVPVILVARRSWTTMVFACLTAGSAAAVSTLVFGPDIWRGWLRSVVAYGHLLQDNQQSLWHAMPTLAVGLNAVGAPALLAYAAQTAAFAVFCVILWRSASTAWDDRAVALALLASLMATPYAFTYDMPMVTAALVLEERRRRVDGAPLSMREIAPSLALFTVIIAMSKYTLPLAAWLLLAWIFAGIALQPRSTRQAPIPTGASRVVAESGG